MEHSYLIIYYDVPIGMSGEKEADNARVIRRERIYAKTANSASQKALKKAKAVEMVRENCNYYSLYAHVRNVEVW